MLYFSICQCIYMADEESRVALYGAITCHQRVDHVNCLWAYGRKIWSWRTVFHNFWIFWWTEFLVGGHCVSFYFTFNSFCFCFSPFVPVHIWFTTINCYSVIFRNKNMKNIKLILWFIIRIAWWRKNHLYICVI